MSQALITIVLTIIITTVPDLGIDIPPSCHKIPPWQKDIQQKKQRTSPLFFVYGKFTYFKYPSPPHLGQFSR